jgi:hypothetical protein
VKAATQFAATTVSEAKTNEKKPMQKIKPLAISAVLVFTGCASFQDQTSSAEPHGIVVVADQSDVPGDVGRVKKLDGLPVSAGRAYRVRPGRHEVTVQFVLTGVEASRPLAVGGGDMPQPPVVVDVSQSGKMSVSESQPFGGIQPVILNAETRSIVSVTNAITVEAGWRYELDGEHVTSSRANE